MGSLTDSRGVLCFGVIQTQRCAVASGSPLFCSFKGEGGAGWLDGFQIEQKAAQGVSVRNLHVDLDFERRITGNRMNGKDKGRGNVGVRRGGRYSNCMYLLNFEEGTHSSALQMGTYMYERGIFSGTYLRRPSLEIDCIVVIPLVPWRV